jgi:PAS domain S-box-containing protein
MNFFQLSIVATLVVNSVLGTMVIVASHRRLLNQLFLLSSLATIYWLGCLLFGSIAQEASSLEFWIRQSTIAGGMIPLMMNAVRLVIVQEHIGWRDLLRRMVLWIIAFACLMVLSQTSFFLIRAELPTAGQTVGSPVYGPGFPLFMLYLVGSLLALVWNVIRDYRGISGIKKTEIQFVLLGWLGSLLLAIVFMVTPQWVNNMEIAMFLPLSDIFRVVVIAYGIAKSRILDLATVLRRLIAYTLMLFYLIALYMVVLHLARALFTDTILQRFYLDHVLAAIAMAATLSPAQGLLQSFANHLFIGPHTIEFGSFIQHSSKLLSSISTIDELVDVIHALIRNEVGAEHVHLLISDNGNFHELKSPNDRRSEGVLIPRASPLATLLTERREAIVREMLTRMRPEHLLLSASVQLKQLDTHLAAGIYAKGDLQGIILLGPRLSGKVYGLIEQQAIEGLAGQLAISLENAKLYTEVQNSRIYNDILLDRLVGGVIAVNAARTVTVFNREAQRITGLEREQVLGAPLTVLPAPLREGLTLSFDQGGSRDIEAVLDDHGREVPIRYGSTRFHSHTNQVLGALLVFTDQTEIKKLEQQVRRTDRLASLGTLAAGMAHEIKNPLVSLKTFSQLLPERYEDADFRDTFTGLLGDEVTRIDRIVNQLLRFARPAKPSLAPVHIHTIIDNTLNLVKQQLRQSNISLIREYGADPDLIHGDADMLVQALLNFFLNAIDAMESRGELKVATALVAHPTNQLDLWGNPVTLQRLRLDIVDNGRGIAPHDLLHVFDPFFTTKASGTGLGMSVSHGIIQEHHGVIDIASEPGHGTTLSILFPPPPAVEAAPS